MRNLVTGGTGLLGQNLVRLLLARGQDVRVLARDLAGARSLAGLPVEVVRGDVRDAAEVAAAVRGVDRVFHSAALVQIGRRNLAAFRSVNALGAGCVAEACRRAGVRMLHVSSVDVLGFGTRESPADEHRPPEHSEWVPYVASKREGDSRVMREIEDGLDAVVVHPAYFLGPWDWRPSSGRLLLAIARGTMLAAPPGGNDFCHVEDVALGCLAAAESGAAGDRFILGGEALTYREAFQLFARVTGGRGPMVTLPAAAAQLAGFAGDALGTLLGREPDLNSGSVHMSCLPHHFSDRKAREALGYRPRPAEAAAIDAWQWFQAHGYAPRPRRP